MKPESAVFLSQARQCLADAIVSANAKVFRIAVREAYLAEFHAAQAIIFEKLNKVAKTHSGVRTEFASLARSHGGLASGATQFLADAYRWKETADYEPAVAAAQFDRDKADAAIAGATRVIDAVEQAINSAEIGQ